MSHGDKVTRRRRASSHAGPRDSPFSAVADEAGASTACSSIRGRPHAARRRAPPQLPFGIAACRPSGRWAPLARGIAAIRDRSATRRVICGLSGGVDSSVPPSSAQGDRRPAHLHLRRQRAAAPRRGAAGGDLFRGHFESRWSTSPRRSAFLPARRRHGPRAEAQDHRRDSSSRCSRRRPRRSRRALLAQGTLYPDVIESVSFKGPAIIKTPPQRRRPAGADEARRWSSRCASCSRTRCARSAASSGCPHEIVWRHPFPGPGLAVRILGEVTRSGSTCCRGGRIVLEEIRTAGLYDAIWQAFAVLLPVRSVGVMGDERTYEYGAACCAP